MRTAPEGMHAEELAAALDHHWGLAIDRMDYLPAGGGAYHWTARTGNDQRWFVTCDDLDTKPWLGSDRVSVFAGLSAAYRAAMDLQRRAGLGFVVAPLPTPSGDSALRVGPRYSLALFPFVEGKPGRWGEPIDPAERTELIGLLAQLHQSASAAGAAPRRGPELPGRWGLEAALAELDRSWESGPFSEAARQLLARYADVVVGWIADFDRLGSRLACSTSEPVVTHGEPHPGNLIRTGEGLALVDWDTVALARPERDLWMLDDDTGLAWETYRQLTGRVVDPDATTLYRSGWALADLAAFIKRLRAPHKQNADTEKVWAAIRQTLTSQEPSPYSSQPTGHP